MKYRLREFVRDLRNLVYRPRTSPSVHWSRVVMNETCRELINSLKISEMDALEISGTGWKKFGFKSYRSVTYPAFDICSEALPESFDIILAEQVFEHLLWPYRAGRNVFAMLRPGGYFMVSTPFLYRVHEFPVDCSRWTELGLRHLLAECGFDFENIQTGSWGNRRCVKAFLTGYKPYNRLVHSLKNEREFPVHVWALARRAMKNPIEVDAKSCPVISAAHGANGAGLGESVPGQDDVDEN